MSYEEISLIGRQCTVCGKTFNFPSELDRHLKSKRKCNIKCCSNKGDYQCKYCTKNFKIDTSYSSHEIHCKYNDEIRNIEIQNNIKIDNLCESTKCRFCNKDFSSTTSVFTHMSKCKHKDVYLNDLLKKGCKKEDTENKQVQQVNNYHIGDKIDNSVTNNNVINIYNGPVLMKFGEENTEYIDMKMILRILQGCRNEGTSNMPEIDKVISKIVRNIHCHPKYKENHNVLMDGEKKSTCHVFTGNGFEIRDAKEVCQKLVQRANWIFQDKAEEIEEERLETKEKFICLGGVNTVRKIQRLEEAAENAKQHGINRASVKEVMCKTDNKDVVRRTKKEYEREMKKAKAKAKEQIHYSKDGTLTVKINE
jgi:hypothetical protein